MPRVNIHSSFAAQLLRGGGAATTGGGQGHLSAALSWVTSLGEGSRLSGWAAAAKALAAQAAFGDDGDHNDHSHIGHGNEEPQYNLIREEDTISWVVFFVIFVSLILFDNIVLHGKDEKLSFGRALSYTMFYMACAGLFCGYIAIARGPEDAFNWGTGYMLEWMLSVDNLFVFRSVFVIFRTPDDQKHKPLFWGIVGAIFFRMFFFIIEEFLVHSFSWMHLLLGAFLIYTGIKILCVDEEEENPSTNPVFKAILKVVPFVDAYASRASFFARIPEHEEQRIKLLMEEDLEPERTGKSGGRTPRSGGRTPRSDTSAADASPMVVTERDAPLKATRLLLVVVCLEVTDVIFAVDSVSAIVAQIPDLFLAYTACVFAMLGLRAMFFVVDELVNLFSLLSYAVAAILVFIGLKLCLRSWFHIPPGVVCTVLVSTVGLSMIASVIWDRYIATEVPEVEKDSGGEAQGAPHETLSKDVSLHEHEGGPAVA